MRGAARAGGRLALAVLGGVALSGVYCGDPSSLLQDDDPRDAWRVLETQGGWSALALGEEQACGSDRETGRFACYPYDATADAANLYPPHSSTPPQVAVGVLVCSLGSNRRVSCWGEVDGVGWRGLSGLPDLVQLDVAGRYACGVDDQQEVHCWGDDEGSDALDEANTNATAVVTGRGHGCLLTTFGEVRCWGDPAGNSALRDFGQALAPPGQFTALSAGHEHTCGLTDAGTIVCWGDPAVVDETPSGLFTELASGRGFSCAAQANRVVSCWGDLGGIEGQTLQADSVKAGGRHVCVLREGNGVSCQVGG